jgi:uncharacterized protein
MTQLEPLDRAECLRLLATRRFGRLAVSAAGQPPLIRPVNYVFDERTSSIVFRSGAGAKLNRLLASGEAAFEIDEQNLADRTGWSVIVRGVVEEITDQFELRRLERLPLDPWAPGARPHWVRIRTRTVSGRRIVDPEASVPAEQSVVSRSSPVVPPG